MDPVDANDVAEDNSILVPKIPVGVSGTALAASLLRDGWSVSVTIVLISMVSYVYKCNFDFVFSWQLAG